MTDPKVPNGDGSERRPLTATQRQEEQLRQLIRLADSIGQITRQTSSSAEPPSLDAQKAQFAYAYLGQLLGRREQGFAVPEVSVVRHVGGGSTLTFGGDLRGGNTARLRAQNGTVEVLPIPDEPEVPIATAIPDDQEIDIIVVFDSSNGVPLAISTCPLRVNNEE